MRDGRSAPRPHFLSEREDPLSAGSRRGDPLSSCSADKRRAAARVAVSQALVFLLPAVWGLLGVPGAASAHGDPPGARAILHVAAQQQRPDVILLDEGLAIARNDGFEFVCAPGADPEDILATAVADTVLVSDGSSGLFILQADGSLAPHPTWAEPGSILQLNSTDAQAYVLVRGQDETRLLRVDASTATVVGRFSWPLTTMAVSAQRLVLAGVQTLIAHWVEIDTMGNLKTHRMFNLPPDVVAVFPRLSAERDFLVTLFSQAAGSELGAVTAAGLQTVHSAATIIAGPVAFEGQLYVAYNGRLGVLEDGAEGVVDVPTGHPVTCVGLRAGVGYACTTVGVFALGAEEEIEEPWFRLDEIVGPARPSCNNAWLSYRLELKQAGVAVPDLTTPATGADVEAEARPADPDLEHQATAEPAGSTAEPAGATTVAPPASDPDAGADPEVVGDAASPTALDPTDGALPDNAPDNSPKTPRHNEAAAGAADVGGCSCRIGGAARPRPKVALALIGLGLLALRARKRGARSRPPSLLTSIAPHREAELRATPPRAGARSDWQRGQK